MSLPDRPVARHLGRLLENDRRGTLIVAMDQGIRGVNHGFEDPVATVGGILAAEPDGLLLTPGLARRASHLFAHRGAPAPGSCR